MLVRSRSFSKNSGSSEHYGVDSADLLGGSIDGYMYVEASDEIWIAFKELVRSQRTRV